MDGCVNTADALSTCDKNLVNSDPVIPEFCRRVCAGRAARWALPRISSHRYWYFGGKWRTKPSVANVERSVLQAASRRDFLQLV